MIQKMVWSSLGAFPLFLVENPLENVPYFKKGVDTAFKVSEYSSFMAPKNCQEYVYRIYLKTKGKEIEKAREIWNSIMM